MASPQLENGHLRIANEIFDHLVKIPLLGSEFQTILFVIRKTYGFNKKVDFISLTQFEKGIRLSRPTIVKAIKNLVKKNILVKSPLLADKISYKLNKNWEEWVVKPPKLVKWNDKGSKAAFTDTSKAALTHKRHILKDNTKDNSEQSSQDGTQEIFNLFYQTINPNINFGNKTDRAAAKWLIDRYGLEKTIAAAKYAISVQNDKYAPTITTPYQLKEKMAALAKHKGSKEQDKQNRTLIL